MSQVQKYKTQKNSLIQIVFLAYYKDPFRTVFRFILFLRNFGMQIKEWISLYLSGLGFSFLKGAS